MAIATAPRVVVADDSALMRRIVGNLLTRDGITVVGSARDGDEALALCRRERPDAMTLDLAMPGKGGIDVLKALRRGDGPAVPVVVVSAFSPVSGARAVDALAEGAFELVPKPSPGEDSTTFEQALLTKVRAAAAQTASRLARPLAGRLRPRPAPAVPVPRPFTARPRRPGPAARTRAASSRAVMIATSTGGPRALAALMPQLPAPLGVGTAIVQHMPPGFTASLAARLDNSSPLRIIEAQGGETLAPSTALLAPGGSHLRLDDDARAYLSDADPIGGLRPRADLLIADAARIYGDRLLLVVMTGMGNDGLAGAREVRRRGGTILVEAEESCTVYGMPRAVAEAQLADEMLPLDRLAAAIRAEVTS